MLSSNSTQLSSGHRRQNSTPTASRTSEKASYHPAHSHHQHSAHRRGLSVDFAMLSQDSGTPYKQDIGNVSTNHGLYEQQNMRAAQMPAMSRPGPDYHYSFEDLDGISTGLDTFVDFPKQFGNIDPQLDPFGWLADDDTNATVRRHTGLPGQRSIARAAGCGNESRSIEVNRQPTTISLTPQKNNLQDCYPMTPNSGSSSFSNRRPLSMDMSLITMDKNETIKASRATAMRRGNSCQESYPMTKHSSVDLRSPNPRNAARLQCSDPFDIAPLPSPAFMDVSDLNINLDVYDHAYDSSSYSPMTNHTSPAMSSFQSSPDLPPVSLFGSDAQILPNFPALPHHQDLTESRDIEGSKKMGSPKKALSSKAQSDDESGFNPMDYIINDTGISEEEINAHIQGPDATGKYSCLYDGCKNGPFGRKENIRAHVQTHLDDRRFRCDVCYNRFVRPNDLKRHWNIHLNKRDFKCVCKAAFNRHDALKRHRERNEWCESGGKRGSPDSPKKEEKKRGRPRKIAPTETQERRERKAYIRRQLLKKKEASTTSSVASSQPSPPPSFEIPDLSQTELALNRYSPPNRSLTPPASPGNSIDDIFSPSYSHHNYTPRGHSMSPPPTRGSMTNSFDLDDINAPNPFGEDLFTETEPSLPTIGSPTKSTSSHYGTPPELELGSSSPSTRFIDFANCSEGDQGANLSQDTGLFDDMVMKPNTDFDKMFPLFGEDTEAFQPVKQNDADTFRNQGQDEMEDIFWAQI